MVVIFELGSINKRTISWPLVGGFTVKMNEIQ